MYHATTVYNVGYTKVNHLLMSKHNGMLLELRHDGSTWG